MYVASGMVGRVSDYAIVVINVCTGIQPMTEQHVMMAAALEIPFFIVLTHIDRVSQSSISQAITSIQAFVERVKPFRITPQVVCFTNETEIDAPDDEKRYEIPLFPISNVTGEGLRVLERYLGHLTRTKVHPA